MFGKESEEKDRSVSETISKYIFLKKNIEIHLHCLYFFYVEIVKKTPPKSHLMHS